MIKKKTAKQIERQRKPKPFTQKYQPITPSHIWTDNQESLDLWRKVTICKKNTHKKANFKKYENLKKKSSDTFEKDNNIYTE